MASSEADSQSQSPLSLLLSPSLDKIIKNGSWRKHAKLVNECRAVLDRIADNNSPSAAADDGSEPDDVPGVLRDGSTDRPYSLSDCEYILGPLIAACASGFPKIADPAVDCVQKLIAHGFVCGEADAKGGPGGKLLWRLLEAVCGCHDSGDDNVELLVLKTLLSAVTSIPLRVHGDCLLMVVRACYDLYLASKNAVNQATAKATLIQMLVIVFRRMEADSSTVPIHPIVVAELMEPAGMADGAGDDSGMIQFVQGFITKIMQDIDGVLNPAATPRKGPMVANHDGGGGGGGGLFETTTVAATNPADLLDSTDKDMLDAKYWEISMYKTALEGRKGELEDGGDGERDGGGGGGHDDSEVQIGNKLRRDAFLVFRALCKLSMRTPPKEASADHQSMRAKIVALELLKILLENAGAIFRTSERFLGAIKQYLCLSLLKNSASTVMIVFQLSCSIFISLVSRFRAGLKAEIGVFFPMLVLRVLENVAQPNFQQKMIVLRFLQKLCVDSQILVDIFLNYDCDVNSSNIFERMVNGLLKTAQGVPSSTTTSRLPLQDVAMKLEAMKCLVAVLRSMGDWMNKQLRIPDAHYSRKSEVAESSPDPGSHPTENGNRDEFVEASDSHSEVPSEISDVSTIKQGRAYKLQLQEGISLFNENPMKGIDFLINANKVGNSPEEVAAFLKSASGLNKTSIGDYLGEGGELCVRVMHAYVDSYDFQDMDFDEAMRSFLQGFRLPGEAQKIDLIMEKFAESYCKCNPKAFTSTDTAYVLAYSVIMLNTDSHNPMVKHKMSADDFIQNNRGIDDGKDVSEEYLRSIFDRISRNEIIVKENDKDQLQKQSMNSNGIIGLESILNIVIHKQWDDKHMETSDDLIRHMQEQFKERTLKSESVYYAATDVVILKFMIEACWAPMLAAFSVPLDQSDDKLMIAQCLDGFRHAIHVTAVMRMKTQRDAFLTSLAKFTFLHSPADIKQKNINAIKVLFAIADEDGNYLQEAWEHILTCVSRFENLHLWQDDAPADAAFFTVHPHELEKSRQVKSTILPVLKKKGAGKFPYAATAVRRGSYESAGIGGNASGALTAVQMSSLVSNLNMLEQVGSSEMNLIFARSQKLNSKAIVDFIKALCKVSMEELHSASDPRVFSLTKIIEIAHYNMNRIRLVWSSIWHVLSEFFVNIGCSENLSIAIFVIDSLRQLSMKFIEREELANYNFQNEFMKPFVIVMDKSTAVEIRELIIRCVSQMVLSRVSNVNSGWKSLFMVLTTAAYDDHKNIVLLAFEMIEKVVRDYFSYITETETTIFIECVNCLIAFAYSRLNKDISLNAIDFLRVCAEKLAEGDHDTLSKKKDIKISGGTSPLRFQSGNDRKQDSGELIRKDDRLYFWPPLLAGLSELSFGSKPEIRKIALQVLFDSLRNYGRLFSLSLWERVFELVLFPIFDHVQAIDHSGDNSPAQGSDDEVGELDQDAWLCETSTLALQLIVDLFVNFYDIVNPLLRKVLMLLVSFISRPDQSLAGIGIAAFVRLISNAGDLFSNEKWLEVVSSLKEAANATLPDFSCVMDGDEMSGRDEDSLSRESGRGSTGSAMDNDGSDSHGVHPLYAAISDSKCRASVQLLLIQAMMEIYNLYRPRLSAENAVALIDALHTVALHAHNINSNTELRSKLQDLGSMTQMQDPPLLRLENESYQMCLTLLQNLLEDSHSPPSSEVECDLVNLCQEVLRFYIDSASTGKIFRPSLRWSIPMGSGKRRELAARAPLVVATLQALCGLEMPSFEKHLYRVYPLIPSLISCEHGSKEVPAALCEMLSTSVGPLLLRTS